MLVRDVVRFKIGDKVKLIKHTPVPPNSKCWTKVAGLEIGKVYTVKRLSGYSITIENDSHYYLYDAECFESVEKISEGRCIIGSW